MGLYSGGKKGGFLAFPSQGCLSAGRQLSCMQQQSSKQPESIYPSVDFKLTSLSSQTQVQLD